MTDTPQSERIAFIDASNGIAGDMLLGALLDAGADIDAVRAAVEAVLPNTVALRSSEVRRAGMRAIKLDVDVLVDDLPHRDWRDIRMMLTDAALPRDVRTRAIEVFTALAVAEGRAHGINPDDVHFHEVGAWDSIADIVGCCAALHDLGLTDLIAGTVGVGQGTMATAHGRLPIPGPAVTELSRGWRIAPVADGELTTPTGMALLAALATPGKLPTGTLTSVGVGAGTRDDPARPNVVRVLLVQPDASEGPAPDSAVLLEANVDDLDPRVWPGVLDRLLAAGAADAWLTPIVMKKGRPAHTLSVLASPTNTGTLRELIFALVPTLGIRESARDRHVLDRTWRSVEVARQQVRIKLGHSAGVIRSATPEYSDVAAAARATGRVEREVLAAAVAAAEAAGLRIGEPVRGQNLTGNAHDDPESGAAPRSV